jgi:hypothetical protein
VAKHGLGERELAIDMNVEDPIRTRHELNGADHALPVGKKSRHQTGGVRGRASGNAVLDADMVAAGHRWAIVTEERRRLDPLARVGSDPIFITIA